MSEKDLNKNPLKLGKSALVPMSENVLYIVDGKEISAKKTQEVKPGNIDNITVLKDKSATELYGEKGKNGVVIITTKKDLSASSDKNSGEKITISGVVLDENNSPIPGATIVVRGTSKGTVSDKNGKFNLSTNKGDEIKITSVNKQTVIVKADKSQNVTIAVKKEN